MIEVTKDAAEQIQVAARESNLLGMPLRIAVKRDANGQFHYAMGFEDNVTEEDKTIQSNGVEIVVSPFSEDLLKGTVLDFVAVDGAEEKQFVFINPNDPNCTVKPEAG